MCGRGLLSTSCHPPGRWRCLLCRHLHSWLLPGLRDKGKPNTYLSPGKRELSMQGIPIILFFSGEGRVSLCTESLYGLDHASDSLQSCSFPVQTVIQQRWLVQRGACALCYLKIFLSSLCTVLCVAMKAGRWPQPVSSRSLSQIWSSECCFGFFFLAIPLGPSCHLNFT